MIDKVTWQDSTKRYRTRNNVHSLARYPADVLPRPMRRSLVGRSARGVVGLMHRRKARALCFREGDKILTEGEIPSPRRDWARDYRPEIFAKQHDVSSLRYAGVTIFGVLVTRLAVFLDWIITIGTLQVLQRRFTKKHTVIPATWQKCWGGGWGVYLRWTSIPSRDPWGVAILLVALCCRKGS